MQQLQPLKLKNTPFYHRFRSNRSPKPNESFYARNKAQEDILFLEALIRQSRKVRTQGRFNDPNQLQVTATKMNYSHEPKESSRERKRFQCPTPMRKTVRTEPKCTLIPQLYKKSICPWERESIDLYQI